MTLQRLRRAALIALTIVAAFSALSSTPVFADAPGGRYVVEQGTVNDTRTRLTWERAPDLTPRVWSQAAPYCSALDLNGKGWRVPSVKELLTLVDESRWGPAIDPAAFPGTPSDYFWTSSPLATFPMFVWTVFFGKGTASFFDIGNPRLVRCVR
jgi:hypothetical protein